VLRDVPRIDRWIEPKRCASDAVFDSSHCLAVLTKESCVMSRSLRFLIGLLCVAMAMTTVERQ
jgi:hypothetical protein